MRRREKLNIRSPSLRAVRTLEDRLRIALSRSRMGDFTALVERGADINTRDHLHKTPLHLVLYWKKDVSIIQAVLEAGADPNAVDYQHLSPLHTAIKYNPDPAIIRALLDAGADINYPDLEGRSPLMRAIYQEDNAPVIQILLERGANAKVDNIIPNAIKGGSDPEAIRLLIKAGASVNEVSRVFPPITYAVMSSNAITLRHLLEAGASTYFVHPENGNTLLHLVTQLGIAEELIKQGVDVNAVNNLGETPLHIAVKDDQLEIAVELINAGADVHELVRRNGDTCMHLVRSSKMVKMLVSQGVDINARNMLGWTPLHAVLQYCNMLLSPIFGDPTNYLNIFSESSVDDRMESCKYAIKRMLMCGADVNAISNNDQTVLELAVSLGHPKVVGYMIDHGVQVRWEKLFALNMMDKTGMKVLIRDSIIGNVKGEKLFDFLPIRGPTRRSVQSLLKYADMCKKEVDSTKKKRVNCKYTLHHYFIETANRIKALRPCPHYDMDNEDLRLLFPLYVDKITHRLNTCLWRACLLDILERIHMPLITDEGSRVVVIIDDCKTAIAEYLSNPDLYRFVRALGVGPISTIFRPKPMNCGEFRPNDT